MSAGEIVGPVVDGEVVEGEVSTQDTGDGPLMAGTFALYQTPDGGFMLVTDIPGRGIEKRHVPGKMVRLVTSGVGAKMFGNLFGGN